MQKLQEQFANWTEYDDWLVQNYQDYSVFSVNEQNGQVIIEYCKRDEFTEYKKQLDDSTKS